MTEYCLYLPYPLSLIHIGHQVLLKFGEFLLLFIRLVGNRRQIRGIIIDRSLLQHEARLVERCHVPFTQKHKQVRESGRSIIVFRSALSSLSPPPLSQQPYLAPRPPHCL